MDHAAFAAALLNPDLPPPPGLVGPDGGPAPRRFAVYRNTVTASLIRVLAAGFPVVERLVGTAFFAAMAGEFLRAHPPRDRRLMLYGADFPTFLLGFPPVAELGYLPDLARLEQALRESYHAADAAPAAHGGFAPEVLAGARLHLAPATRLIRSAWPIHAIWCAQTEGGPPPVMAAQDVAVLRKGYEPRPVLLGPGGADVLQALMAGERLALAAGRGGAGFDLGAFFRVLLQHQVITGVSP